jgi:hypothetical protein
MESEQQPGSSGTGGRCGACDGGDGDAVVEEEWTEQVDPEAEASQVTEVCQAIRAEPT